MPKTDRTEVYAAIDTELWYQHTQFGENPHEIDTFATYIRRYSALLDEAVTSPNPDFIKLAAVRKIAAIAVRCMEQHGAPKRVLGASNGN